MPIIIDLIMMGLLIGVIIHSSQLSKSLKGFKKLHSEIVPLMRDYTQTVQTSLQQIEGMKQISGEIEHIIKSRVPEALKIQKDLDFLVGRSEELADHLELIIRTGRDQEFMTLNKGPMDKGVSNKETTARETLKQTINFAQDTLEDELQRLINSESMAPKDNVNRVVRKDVSSADSATAGSITLSTKGERQSPRTRGKSKAKGSFKPMVESFFLTKTAKKLLGKDHETDRETNHAA